MVTTRTRHYALVSNIDLRMLRRQKNRLVTILAKSKDDASVFLDHNDKHALDGILNLLDAIQDNCKISANYENPKKIRAINQILSGLGKGLEL